MANNEIVQLTIKGTLDGQDTNNVLHLRSTSSILYDEEALAEAIIECFVDSLLPGLSSDFTLHSVSAKRILPSVGNEVIVNAPANSNGLVSGSLPSFNAAVISLRSAVGSKSGRGRMYIAGIPNSGETASMVSTSLQSTLAAFVTCMFGKFVSDLSLSGFEWGVFSRKNHQAVPNDMPSWWRAITSASVNSAIGTMRSRKVGSGS
jgi:hypothetical protein